MDLNSSMGSRKRRSTTDSNHDKLTVGGIAPPQLSMGGIFEAPNFKQIPTTSHELHIPSAGLMPIDQYNTSMMQHEVIAENYINNLATAEGGVASPSNAIIVQDRMQAAHQRNSVISR